MTSTMDPTFAGALRRALVDLPAESAARRPRRRRRLALLAGATALTMGGAAVAVADLRPADEIADPPLGVPLIVSGVGSQDVPLPRPPSGARYVSYELTCFDAMACGTPAGGWTADRAHRGTDRGTLPLTGEADPTNPQELSPVDPARGIAVSVDGDAHWRLYAVFVPRREMQDAPVGDGRWLGVPSLSATDLVPVRTTSGRLGWVDYRALTEPGDVRLTASGVQQPPLPVYAADGTTVIGEADVSAVNRGSAE